MQEAKHILELIPKADGAAALVIPRAAKHAGAPRLVKQPPIEEHIHPPIRRLHLHGGKPCLPECFYHLEARLHRVRIQGDKRGNRFRRILAHQ